MTTDSIAVEDLTGPDGPGLSLNALDINDAGEVVGWEYPVGVTQPGDVFRTILWTESAGGPAVVVVTGDAAQCPRSERLDNHAALVGLTRVLACDNVYEIDVD